MRKLSLISLAILAFTAQAQANNAPKVEIGEQQCLALKDSNLYPPQITKAEWFNGGELPSDEHASLTGAGENYCNWNARANC